MTSGHDRRIGAVGRRMLLLAIAGALCCAMASRAEAQREKPKSPAEQAAEAAKIEYKAKSMVDRGIELVETGQEERGIKMISSVPRNYPKAKARFRAWLYLGKHHLKKGDYPLAIKSLRQVEDSEDPDQKADAIYQTGICHFQMDRFNNAFMAFRKVTNEYPWSVYANEAYYYIGQCHFKLGRWAKAIEALEMVGTSVPPNLKTMSVAEAGQRLYVKVYDKDFAILAAKGEPIRLQVRARTGDEETITLAQLGRSGEYFIGSVRTAPGKPGKGDDVLQFLGDDVVTAVYVDKNTKSGKVDQKLISTIKLVSTAAMGFTDGAYREYTQGVYGDKDCFLRVKDLDQDKTDGRDKVPVKLHTEYTVKKYAGEESEDTDLEAPEVQTHVRDRLDRELVETGPHTGIFVGSLIPRIVAAETPADTKIDQTDEVLSAIPGDDIVLSYSDQLHMFGTEPRPLTAKAKLLIGQIQDVRIEHRIVDSPRDKARKNLIEGKIFLKLGQIFKDVGLREKASDKAQEGLNRIEDVLSLRQKAALDRSVVEEAYSVKWDLLLVQDKLGAAIAVCRDLMALFPDSALVDAALFKIAVAKAEAEDYPEAIRIFTEVTKLDNSGHAAEAQFRIAEIHETMAVAAAAAKGGTQGPQMLSKAMQAYQKCAESYPDSPFAGQALEKIAQYYIDTKDYARAIELMERVFTDYEDADFLPNMLVKWVITAMRMGDYRQAREKADQLRTQYPKMAAKAKRYLDVIEKQLPDTPAE